MATRHLRASAFRCMWVFEELPPKVWKIDKPEARASLQADGGADFVRDGRRAQVAATSGRSGLGERRAG
jgi:hypothetical protein